MVQQVWENYCIQDFEIRRKDLRGALICKLMFQGGLRISDVLHSVTKEKVYLQDGTVRHEIAFNDKKTGKKNSTFVYEPGTAEGERGELYRMLKEHRITLNKNRRNSTLFYNIKRRSPLSERGMNYLLSSYIGIMNIEQCSCHGFRKGVASYLAYEKKEPIEAIRDFLNHSLASTTMRYAKIKSKDQLAIGKILDQK